MFSGSRALNFPTDVGPIADCAVNGLVSLPLRDLRASSTVALKSANECSLPT